MKKKSEVKTVISMPKAFKRAFAYESVRAIFMCHSLKKVTEKKITLWETN